MANASPLSKARRSSTRHKNRHQELDELCKSAMEKDGGRLLELVRSLVADS